MQDRFGLPIWPHPLSESTIPRPAAGWRGHQPFLLMLCALVYVLTDSRELTLGRMLTCAGASCLFWWQTLKSPAHSGSRGAVSRSSPRGS